MLITGEHTEYTSMLCKALPDLVDPSQHTLMNAVQYVHCYLGTAEEHLLVNLFVDEHVHCLSCVLN